MRASIKAVTAGICTACVITWLPGCGSDQDPREPGVQQLRWATSAVGSAGHRAKVSLMALLTREWDGYQISVMPTSGAVASIRGYATGQFDGYYGADIAFRELAEDSGRFRGFGGRVEREPLQSFWAYTMEVGLAVHAGRSDAQNWSDLAGKTLFTGPAAWDVKAQLDRALGVLDTGYRYRELDLGIAGNALGAGSIDGIAAYTAGERSLAAWVSEAALATPLRIVNPDTDEITRLREAGMEVVAVDAQRLRSEVGVDTAYLVPFFYGFHLGAEVPEEAVYRMLRIVEQHAGRLAESDPVFAQLAEDMPRLQQRGITASAGSVRIHPGLARYLRAVDAWRPEWDDRVWHDDAS